MATADKLKRQSHGQQLKRLQDEVQSLRQQLARSQRLATVGTMAAMVAHEFNNILTPIINYAQLARTNPALVDKAIARAADGGQRASTICKAIMGVARNDSPLPQPVELAELIGQTLEAMAREPAKDGIDLQIDVPAALSLTVRRVELQQVLLNLLLNARAAVKARPAPRLIQVRAQAEGSAVRLEVCDNGPGIPPENLQLIFEPFFTTHEDGQGHGLGLAICRDIMTALGGSISVRSSAGEGATFTLNLPASAVA